MKTVAFALGAAYLVGSIPFGLLVVRVTAGKDLRRHGSRNIGATNALRTGGVATGLTTLLLDTLKGAAGTGLGLVLLGQSSVDPSSWPASLVVLAPAVGHCWPAWLGFRGGKGVATTFGVLAVADWRIAAIAAFAFAAAVASTRIVSVGSLAAAAAISVCAVVFHAGAPLTAVLAGLVSIIVIRHRENISRIMAGTERRLGKDRDA